MRLTSSPGASRSEKSTGKATQKSVDSLWENLTEPLLVEEYNRATFPYKCRCGKKHTNT